MTAGRIFINYRREDSQAAAGRLYDRFLTHFARDRVFMDVDGIAPGTDFVKTLESQLANCSACVAVIGPHWAANKGPDGARRLDNPTAYVRIELETALRRDIRLIPVLVDGARMPAASDLPPSLTALARRQAVEVTHTRFGADADELAKAVGDAIGIPVTARTAGDVKDENPRTLADRLFSFKGRMSRAAYWKCFALVFAIMVFLLAALMGIMMSLAGTADIFAATDFTIGPDDMRARILGIVVALVFQWPMLAIQLKRLHDFNHGWELLIPLFVVNNGHSVLSLMSHPAAAPAFWVGIVLWVILGFVKGTPGSNAYGPDPLVQR